MNETGKKREKDLILNDACSLIEACRFIEGRDFLKNEMKFKLQDNDIAFAIMCCNFWIDSPVTGATPLEKGEFYFSRWKQFLKICVHNVENPSRRILYSFRKGIFSMALEQFKIASAENDDMIQSDIYRKTGLCYKKLDSYEDALVYLQHSNKLCQKRSCVIAEMADCYAFCGMEKEAKMLFREAFYIDEKKIDLDFLDSSLIRTLIGKVSAMGYEGQELLEWIPVYGVIYKVFTVKRPFKTNEILRLKQEIYAKETELKSNPPNAAIIRPRLMNLYFWLLDYYSMSKDSVTKVNEVIIKMKLLDAQIYKLYVQ